MFSMTTKISKIADNSPNILFAIRELERNNVLAGVPASKASRDSEEAGGAPINNAALGYIHNYGSPAANIPARPFMEPGIVSAKKEIEKGLEMAADAAFDGKVSGVQKGLNRAGIAAVTGIKLKINMGPFTPLKPSTIAARRARGRTGTRPLIDTAQLRNSITYVIRRK